MSDVTGILAATNQYHLAWDYVELITGLREAFVLLRAALCLLLLSLLLIERLQSSNLNGNRHSPH